MYAAISVLTCGAFNHLGGGKRHGVIKFSFLVSVFIMVLANSIGSSSHNIDSLDSINRVRGDLKETLLLLVFV